MKKVGIATVFTGYNYGSSLQAYATKCIIQKLGYEAIILGQKGSIIKGRDIRFKKIACIIMRILIHPVIRKNIKIYADSTKIYVSNKTKMLFNDFIKNYINPEMCSWKSLKQLANKDDYVAFLCGSDQVWNADSAYVDPFYYLQFAPIQKRIAFSPSFGRNEIASYNKKIISKYINCIPKLSVREESGVKIINDLTGKSAEHLLDPTLILTKEEWFDYLAIQKINSSYAVAYFLNNPSDNAINQIIAFRKNTGLKIISIPKRETKEEWFDESIDAGPKEFISLVFNSSYVFTDSFHGTAFALNFNIPFYVFDRQYGNASVQSSRIDSLLKLVNLENRFNPKVICESSIDFNYANNILHNERQKSINYLKRNIL